MHVIVLKPEWDCTTCTAPQKELRGCTGTPTQPIVFADETLERCPRRPLLDDGADYDEVFWLYQNYARGILPYGSSLYKHPHKLVQMFRMIDLAKGEATAEREKRDKRREAMRQQFNAAKGR